MLVPCWVIEWWRRGETLLWGGGSWRGLGRGWWGWGMRRWRAWLRGDRGNMVVYALMPLAGLATPPPHSPLVLLLLMVRLLVLAPLMCW